MLRRCWAALYPRAPFLDVLDGNPDLYGPFWIATTVVFILFLAGSINARWGRLSGDPGADGGGFDWALLSGSAGLIYAYTGLVPVALWAVLRWFGSESANLLECWCLYGYANLIWIPVAMISWSWIDGMFLFLNYSRNSPFILTSFTVLNFVFVAVGFALSALFIVRNLYPVLSATDVRTSKILLIVVVVLHAGLAIAIKVFFFAHGSPVANNTQPPDPKTPPPTEGSGEEKPGMRYLW